MKTDNRYKFRVDDGFKMCVYRDQGQPYSAIHVKIKRISPKGNRITLEHMFYSGKSHMLRLGPRMHQTINISRNWLIQRMKMSDAWRIGRDGNYRIIGR